MKCLSKDPRAIKAAAEFPKRLAEIHGKKIELRPEAVYQNGSSRIEVVCCVCGHNWEPTPKALLDHQGCPACSNQRKRDCAGTIRKPRASKAKKAFANACRDAGLSYRAIGQMLSCNPSTINNWCDSEIRERQRQRVVEYRKANPERDRFNSKRYSDTPHGRAANNKRSAQRRALEYHAVFDVEIDGRLVEVNNWELIKGDSDAMDLFSFAGADEAWKAKQEQCKKLERISGIKWSIDHLVPLSRGGIHHPSNFKLVPLADNTSKNNRVVPEDYALFARRIFNID